MDNEFDSVENFEEIAGPSLTDSVCSPEESADGQKEEIQSEDILCGGCPETVIVAPASPCHTDKYTGPCGTYAAAERQTIQPAGGVSPGDKETKKKREIRINPLALAAVCLICSLIGGIVCLTGYYLVNGKTPGTTSNGSTDGSSKVSSPSGTNTSLTQEITITSDGSVSPAAAVAKKVLPSIVGIEVSVTSASGKYNSVSSVSQGSGVIFTEDGYIITNYHVVEDVLTSAGESNPNATMNVFLYTDPDTAISAELIGYDQGADLAVIKIDRTGLTAVEIGDSDALEVGELAIAIGNPGGLDFLGSVCQGIISGLNRRVQTEDKYQDLTLIQTDAAINPGNSGGALVNSEGKLIGINSVKIVSDGYEGMGFAIPVNDVVSICTAIIKNGNVRTAYLGVELNSNYSAEYLQRLGYPGGLLVGSVMSGSPAETAGIQEDDIIVSFNGTEVKEASELAALKNACAPGDVVTIRVYRLTSGRFGRWTGEYIDLTVTLG